MLFSKNELSQMFLSIQGKIAISWNSFHGFLPLRFFLLKTPVGDNKNMGDSFAGGMNKNVYFQFFDW